MSSEPEPTPEDYTDASEGEETYQGPDDIDFGILVNAWRGLALFERDLYLGMQGMNLGLTDQPIMDWEYQVLHELLDGERTPPFTVTLNAFSQQWIYSAYELLRTWKERTKQFQIWFKNGALDQMIKNMEPAKEDLNLSAHIRVEQLKNYRDDPDFRKRVDGEWETFEPIFLALTDLRMPLAKHEVAGSKLLARTPGYGRIHGECGSMTWEITFKDGSYTTMCRRDIADALRRAFRGEVMPWFTGDPSEVVPPPPQS